MARRRRSHPKDIRPGKGGTKNERTRFLLYVEGECTEHLYFEGLYQEVKSPALAVFIGGRHGEPKKVVRGAIAAKKEAEAKSEPYDEVWCVLDVEAPEPHSAFAEALRLAEKNGIKCAISNPCFEIWLLQHHRYSTKHLSSAEAARELEQRSNCYTVKQKRIDYQNFRERRGQAISAAARLHTHFTGVVDLTRRNPWTSVDVLVQLILDNA